MDIIDKGIFYALDANCRVSYEALARDFNISANAIKKRVTKLQNSGVLKRFAVWLSLSMIDSEMLVAFIRTDGGYDDESLINAIGNNPMIHRAAYLSNGNIVAFGEYNGATGLNELSRFLRNLDGVAEIEVHTLLTEKGGKVKFTPLQLKVLAQLRKDARMSIVNLAKETGLTARTIRRVLDQLGGNKATTRAFVIRDKLRPEEKASNEPVHFRSFWNLNASGNISYAARITYNEDRGKPTELDAWLRKKYPVEHWYSYASASEPLLFSTFIVENVGVFEKIHQVLRRVPVIDSVETLVFFPYRHYKGLRELRLEEMLAEAGF
ncbi:MAG: winged helix-turn-helix transcriptional regulator [Promethearchaeota archaeon]